MRRACLLTLTCFALVALVATAPAGAVSPFDRAAIFALNSVDLERFGIVVHGDIVVDDYPSGPTLIPGFSLGVAQGALVNGDLYGPTIWINRNATVDGDAFCDSLRLDGTLTGDPCTNQVLFPLYGAPPFRTAVIRPGAPDVVVPAGGLTVLPPGGYGDIVIGNSGTVVLTGGADAYDVNSITGGLGTRLEFDGPIDLRVLGRFVIGRESYIGPAAGSGVSASEAVIYAAGPDATTPAIWIGRSSQVAATLYAQSGTVQIDKNSTVEGALLGVDVQVRRDTTITVDAFFGNQPPTADPQTVTTSGPGTITITLTGSDPEGNDLGFSIVSGPSAGSLGAVVPIVPTAGVCSVTGGACTAGGGECPAGESCVIPPIASATVDYTPNSGNDDPDAFTFRVTDDCGETATAVVTINPVDPSPPPPPLGAVDATDVSVDTTTDTPVVIALRAGGAPGTTITFSIESFPSFGALTDSDNNPIESVPYALPTRFVTYSPNLGFTGDDSFGFGASDDQAPPTSDTATAFVGVDRALELAEDQQVSTGLNTPVQFILDANPGGAASGGQAPQQQTVTYRPQDSFAGESGSSGPSRSASSLVPAGAGGPANGAREAGAITRGLIEAQTGPVPLVSGAGWSATSNVPPAFFWGGTIPVFADEGPFTFSGTGCVSVTDDFLKGDQFRIYDGGVAIGTTPAVAVDSGAGEVGPDAAFADPTYSSGTFVVGPGAHSITIEVIGASFGSGRGYIRLDPLGSSFCPVNLTVTSFTAPNAAALDEPIGNLLVATVANTGSFPIPAGTDADIGYYVSTDATITTADTLLAGGRENLSQQAPSGLAPGQSVQIQLFAGANIAANSNPPQGNVFIGVLVDEFDDVSETNEADNSLSAPIVVGQSPGLTWTITQLPANGTLRTLSGSLVTLNQTFSSTPTLVYTPALNYSGPDIVEYQVTEGLASDLAVVIFDVQFFDSCAAVGRPPGCVPGGTGGSAPQADTAAEAGLTVEVVGSGSVSSNPRQILHGRVVGIICSDRCGADFPEGETVLLFARPTGADSEFVRWSGDCSGSSPVASVRVGASARSCTAHFRSIEPDRDR